MPGYSSGRAREMWYLSLDRAGDRRLSFETSGSVNDSSSPYQTFNVALFSNVSTFAGITGSKTVSPSAPVPPDPDPPELYWRGDGVPGNWDTLSPNWTIIGVGSTVWKDGKTAIFRATPGTVTTTAAVSANQLVFQVGGYTINGSSSNTITLTATGSSATSGAIYATNTNSTNTISAPIILGGAAGTGALFSQAGTGTLEISGTISSANSILGLSLVQNTTGTAPVFTFSGANTYSGITVLNSQVRLNINSPTAISSGTLSIRGGGVSIDNTSGNAITLANNNAINLSFGSLTFVGTNDLSFGSGAVNLGDDTATRSITVTAGTLTVGAITEEISKSFTKSGAGTLVVTGSSTYSGGTIVNAGTLQLSGSGTLGSTTAALAINGGTLNLGGTNQTVGALNGTGGSITTTGSSTLAVGNGGASGSYAGSITNTGTIALTKAGAGTQTLTSNNSYTGLTKIDGGTLELKNTGGVALSGTSSVQVNSGGTLLFSANNQINQATLPGITVASATIDAGGVSQGTAGVPPLANTGTIGLGSLTMTASSIIDLTGTSVLHFSNSSGLWAGGTTLSIWDWTGVPSTGGGSEQILFGGDITGLSAGQLLQVNFYSDGGSTLISNTALILADGEIVPGPMVPIPEPSTWVGAALALAAIGFTQRKKLRGLIVKRA